MKFFTIRTKAWCALLCLIIVCATNTNAQQKNEIALIGNEFLDRPAKTDEPKSLVASVLPNYYDPQDGISLNELIGMALSANQDLAAARLNIEKAKARLAQAKLRPNPTLEFEKSSGRVVANADDGSFTVGVALPIEIYSRREARINFANIEIQASEAEVRNRERILAANILTNYAEAMGALREIEAIEKVLELDTQTTKFVQIRVNEGETAPLELNLLQAEVERLRSRRQLAEGKLQASLIQLKSLAGIDFNEPLRLREQINTAILPTIPKTREEAVSAALQIRPDVLLTRVEEQAATAGLRLVRANSKPDLTAYTRYSQGQTQISINTGNFPQRDRSLSFGVAIGIPLFNQNQGAKTEAEISVRQAQARREFAERVVRSEILSAYQRFESANRAVTTLQNAAIPRATENVETFRRIYELGEIKITDLINEQRRLLDTNRDLTDALIEKYRAQSDLQIALGAGGLLPEPK